MGGVPGKHTSRSKARRRRSHLALTPRNLIACPECGAARMPHRYCENCGYYKGKDVKKKIAEMVKEKK